MTKTQVHLFFPPRKKNQQTNQKLFVKKWPSSKPSLMRPKHSKAHTDWCDESRNIVHDEYFELLLLVALVPPISPRHDWLWYVACDAWGQKTQGALESKVKRLSYTPRCFRFPKSVAVANESLHYRDPTGGCLCPETAHRHSHHWKRIAQQLQQQQQQQQQQQPLPKERLASLLADSSVCLVQLSHKFIMHSSQ